MFLTLERPKFHSKMCYNELAVVFQKSFNYPNCFLVALFYPKIIKNYSFKFFEKALKSPRAVMLRFYKRIKRY